MAAITAAEIVFRYSTTAGAAGNSTASSAAASLGKYISTTPWAGGVANDLFDDISGVENVASVVDYRCIFVYNSNTANALQNATVYLSAEVAGGASIAVAVDNLAASTLASASAQAAQIANETTAPTGVGAFSSPTTAATGVALGSIPAGSVRAFWVRRTAANSAALSGDGVTIAVTGDTGSL
jgi:hypothetical protein